MTVTQKFSLVMKHHRQMNFVKQHLTDGFLIRKRINASKLDIADVLKRALLHNKNVKNVSVINIRKRNKRTTILPPLLELLPDFVLSFQFWHPFYPADLLLYLSSGRDNPCGPGHE